MFESAGQVSRRRLVRRVVATGTAIAFATLMMAACSDDTGGSDPTATTALADIQSSASVTGITAANSPSSVSDAGNGVRPLQRTLLEPGRFTCSDTGVWMPYPELDLTLLVGQPADGSSCTGDVLDMPSGSCSVDPCAEVPADWRIDTMPGVVAEALMMVVAPTSASVSADTAQFICVVDLVPQPKQILPDTATIEQACPAGISSNSIDIPYVPPGTSDIPYVPPPASVDIPAG